MEPPWKKIRLSLEPPYKDDNGEHILQLLDITPDGEQIYKQREEPFSRLGKSLERIIDERGFDFFSKYHEGGGWEDDEPAATSSDEDVAEDDHEVSAEKSKKTTGKDKPMTTEELFEMRREVIQHLFVALGEMTFARDLLSILTATAGTSIQPPPMSGLSAGALSATKVVKQPPLPSVQAFNAQLKLAAKDDALRKAADVFWDASESMERARKHDEPYWVAALTARQGNWGLLPAPLPPGIPFGKGSDKSARDFIISYGLEEAPATFKRRGLASISTDTGSGSPLVFQRQQRTRLQVSLRDTRTNATTCNSFIHQDISEINPALSDAQRELVEQEIFSYLIKEAGSLPTAETRVSERLIVIEAAENVELRFEMVPCLGETSEQTPSDPACDLIYACLQLFMLRFHAFVKNQHLAPSFQRGPLGGMRAVPPRVLQPVVDLIQYHSFCDRIETELRKLMSPLAIIGVGAKLRFSRIGERGEDLVSMLSDAHAKGRLGGEAVLRIDRQPTLRLTFQSPSTLTAQLPLANITLASLPQLSHLLREEVQQCLLEKLAQLGEKTCGTTKSSWRMDRLSMKTIGKWDEHIVTFTLALDSSYAVFAEATTVKTPFSHSVESQLVVGQQTLYDWAKSVVAAASAP